MTDSDLDPEPTDPIGASPNLHDGQNREFVQQDPKHVEPRPVGPTARLHSRSRELADRDPTLPIAYRATRWSAVALISATTMLTAWWLVHAGVVGWFDGLLWYYLSWPFVD